MLKTALSAAIALVGMILIAETVVTADRGLGNNGTDCFRFGGPDVIVGDLRGVSNYSSVDGIEAFAFGTESCNVGDEVLLWNEGTNQKPVIGQSFYQYKDGRIRMLGQGWLKHGFFALSDNWCGCGCTGTDGTVLGIGCSDLYSSGLNGQQSNMGPKYEVNAFTGEYPYPPTNGSATGNGIYKRVQVKISDLDPAQNGGGIYFVEAQYVSPDDAAAGNHFNNSSWTFAEVTGSGDSWYINPGFTNTVRESQVLRVWPFLDLDAAVHDVYVENEGLVLVACKVRPYGDGTWQYDYAIQNFNSDRCISSFEIPLAPGAEVTEVGFHDVDYHSGSPVDGTDWSWAVGSDKIRWECPEEYDDNIWANAIRWGTTYSFQFVCNVNPEEAESTLGVFKPPVADSKAMSTSVVLRTPTGNTDPTGSCCIVSHCEMKSEVACLAEGGDYQGDWELCDIYVCMDSCEGDYDGNNAVDVNDLLGVIGEWGCIGACSADFNSDGQVTVEDLLIVIANWGSC
ncbi:MAG: hypothetical protein P8K80_02740 [Phycisphaerales bacterium]|nr:hypothetical protein [Phycisphaerales bacterium]